MVDLSKLADSLVANPPAQPPDITQLRMRADRIRRRRKAVALAGTVLLVGGIGISSSLALAKRDPAFQVSAKPPVAQVPVAGAPTPPELISPPSNHLPPALRSAIDKTLAVRSARAQTTGDSTSTAIYQAPDRATHSQQATGPPLPDGSRVTVTRTLIGEDIYTQLPGQPLTQAKAQNRGSAHQAALNQLFTPILVLNTATEVTASGDTYQYTAVLHALPQGSADLVVTGTAKVRDGYIVQIDSTSTGPAGGHTVTTFDEFNSAPPVTPPS